VSFLQARGAHLGVLASTGCGGGIPNVACFEIDIRNSEQVCCAVQKFQPDHIYHLAAVSSVDNSWKSPRLTYEVNVFGTLNILDAASKLAARPRILNVSTAQVYAKSTNALSEESPLAPDNPYAASKAMAEMLKMQGPNNAAYGMITARSFNHAGPGQSPDFVLSSIAKQFAEIGAGLRDPKLVLGNIQVKRDFTDVRDVVRAYCLLLEKGSSNQVYNICSGRAWSIADLVAQFESISGIKVQIETDANRLRGAEINTVCGNPAKIRAVTGWESKISIMTTIADTLNCWRSALDDQTGVREQARHEDNNQSCSPSLFYSK